MDFFKSYLRSHILPVLAFILCSAAAALIFLLYSLPLEALVYPFIMCLFICLCLACIDFVRAYKKHLRLRRLLESTAELISDKLPDIVCLDDADYQAIIRTLSAQQTGTLRGIEKRYRDTVDYYTVWVHQIKTPIAAMKLRLQGEDSTLSRRLSSELGRIEQYVDMVLVYLRLDMESTDYVFAEISLDELVKSAVRRFAGEFIDRGLALKLSPIELRPISDEKWLSFVLEQLLSNALKYTPSGSVSIYQQGETLCIEDTGIGIAPEDLSRVFQNGYTGYNGRLDKRATGIGLYLCKRICDRLGHEISISSEPEKGSCVKINFSQYRPERE